MPMTQIKVENPGAGRLVIAGIHDGPCGIGAGAPLSVAFRWSRRGKRPELAASSEAMLDGVGHRIVSVARSPISEGFYIAVLTPCPPTEPAGVSGPA